MKSVSHATHLDNLSQTSFTNGKYNKPTSVELADVINKQFQFADFFDINPYVKEDYKDLLKNNVMTLIHLKGAEKTNFDNSSSMLKEAWTTFANGRFNQLKV